MSASISSLNIVTLFAFKTISCPPIFILNTPSDLNVSYTCEPNVAFKTSIVILNVFKSLLYVEIIESATSSPTGPIASISIKSFKNAALNNIAAKSLNAFLISFVPVSPKS